MAISTVSFGNTPQAKDDYYSYSESIESTITYLNVMANDLGGNAKTLYSLDNAMSTYVSGDPNRPADLLQADAVNAVQYSKLGAKIWITSDGKVAYDTSPLGDLDYLAAGQHLTDTFTYAIRMGNGTLSWATATVDIVGSNDGPVLSDTADPAAVLELGDAAAQNLAPITGNFSVSDLDVGNTLTPSIVGAPVVQLNGGAFALPAGATALTAAGAFTLTGAISNGGSVNIGYSYDPGAANLDFLRAGQSLTITYTIKVNDGTTDSGTQDVTFTITGVNDGPVLSDTVDPAAVLELGDAAAQDLAPIAGNFSVSDLDVGDTLTPSVVGSPLVQLNGGAFALPAGAAALTAVGAFSLTGAISNGGPVNIGYSYDPGAANLDFLTAGDSLTITYTVKVNDGTTDSGTQTVTFTITGTNDDANITVVGTPDTEVIEAGGVANAIAGDPDASGQLTVSDPDAGESKFQTPGSLDGAYGTFKFDADSGAWSYSLNQGKADELFDGEAAGDSLTVTSLDGSARYVINVDITGSNDAPVAKDDTDSATEDAAIVNGSVADNDSDVDAGATLTYTLDAPVAGLTLKDDGTYSFDPSDPAYQHLAAGKSVDVVANYTVTDDKGATDKATLTITITGVNDAPTITSNDGGDEASISIAENTSAVTKVAADDPDDGAILKYKIAGGADSALFSIDEGTGALSFIAAPNFEAPGDDGKDNVYDVVVQAWDGTDGDTQLLHVTITDVNEAPTLTVDATPVDAAEDTAAGTVLADVDGTDPDVGGGNDGANNFEDLTYSITAGNGAGLFAIDAATGEISLAAGKSFDFEAAQQYVLTVRVTDGPGLFDEKTVTVNVTDVNEAPTLTVDATPVSAAEDTAAGMVLADVDGTDPDFGGGNDGASNFEDLTYSITAGNAAGLFAIDAATGEISLAAGKSFDFEAAQQYVLTVRVTDGPGLFDEKTVTINVTDVNEAPTLTVDATPVSAAENTAAGTVLADVDGTDPDTGGGNDVANNFEDLTYSITAGNGAGLFAIDAATGEISLAAGKSFNFEATQQYVLTVRVTDGPGLFDEKTVTIDVTDVNEAPTLTVDATPVSAAENTAAGTVLADVDGSDPDFGGGNDGANNFEDLTYSITAGNGAGLFAIDATTGEISLAVGKSFDFEAAQQYVLTVRVTDGPGLFDEKTVTINVTDVNEAPTLTVDATPVSVAENAAVGTVVGDVDGTDPDVGGGNDGANTFEDLKYSIVSVDGLTSGAIYSLFAIDGATGTVSLAGALDYETDQSYSIVIKVEDGPGLFAQQTLVVNVTDVAEGDPNDFDDKTGTNSPTSGDDVIVGTSGAETINAQDGNDQVYGTEGNDSLSGAGGNDIIYGGSGNDDINGNGGLDSLYGGSGADTINGNNEGDTIIGGFDADLLTGNKGTDTFVYLSLNDGKDTISDFDIDAPNTSDDGDVLDISAVLDLAGNTWTDGKDLTFAVTNGYISFTNSGGATQVNVDIDGAGVAFASTALAVLTGVNPATAAANLSDNIVLG